MKTVTAILVLTALSTTVACASFYSAPQDFSTFNNGDPLTGGTKGSWTSVNAFITNQNAFSADRAAYFGAGASGTNTVGVNNPSPSRVWTDFRIKPALGVEPGGEIPAGVQTLFFFDTDGYIKYRQGTAWVTASNNIFGGDVISLTNAAIAGNWQRVSVFQDYTDGTYALVLNDVVIAQDIPFVNTGSSYQRFTLENQDNEAFLDEIRIHNSLPTDDPLTGNNNATINAIPDATELDTYGYVARTLSVDDDFASPTPLLQFTQLSAALAAYRANDVITVAAGTYDGITVSNNVTLTGSGFTVAAITVQDGATLTLGHNVLVTGAISVAAGSSLVAQGTLGAASTAIAGTLTTGTGALTVASLGVSAGGTLTLGGNASSTTATVAGTINVGNHTLTVSGLVDLNAIGGNIQIGANGTLTAGTIEMDTGTQIASTSASGSLVNTLLTMTGIFTIQGENWNQPSATAQTLPFTDDFERYNQGQAMQDLKLFGWNANASSVIVQATEKAAGSKSVILPDGTELTLKISGAGQSKVWTDFYLRPALGVEPGSASSAVGKGFSSFVDNDGNLNAATVSGGTTNWFPLGNKARWNSGALEFDVEFANQFSATTFTRVSVFQDFEKSTFSVFVGTTNLVAVAKPFPGTLTAYTTFVVENSQSNAYLDEMRVLAALPFAPGDPKVDINGNGMDDREEIHWFGDLSTYAGIRGSVFRFM